MSSTHISLLLLCLQGFELMIFPGFCAFFLTCSLLNEKRVKFIGKRQ